MTKPAIQITSSNDQSPKPAHIPLQRARRWRSDIEDNDHNPTFPIFLTQKAYIKICVHAGSDLDNEIGGWLLGKWCVDQTTQEEFVVVEANLPAVFTRSGSAFLTFTQDSQVAMHDLMEDRYPGKELVGWYHTHPRMGIFLSTYDVWLHKNFFTKPWQMALVIEPHSNVAGFFTRDSEGELDSRYYRGFYEIDNGQDRSVVHWKNMEPEPVADVEGG
jgi:proteasome lid subunit RPN8/RPN11